MTINPTEDTTYTLTVSGNSSSATCSASVNVPEPEPEPTCSISFSPSSITEGESSTLSWNTSNVNDASIDQGIGDVSLSGSQSVSPNSDKTYTMTATGSGGTVTCEALVEVVQPTSSPVCSMSVGSDNINEGEDTILSWSSENTEEVTIDQGIGEVDLDGDRTVSPSSDITYTGQFVGEGGTTTCSADVDVTSDGGGSGGGGSSGGGGGGVPADAEVSLAQNPVESPLASVYLSQVPYTGLDFGSWNDIIFILGLLAWSLLVAHLLVNKGMGETFIEFAKNNVILGNIYKFVKSFVDFKPSFAREPRVIHEEYLDDNQAGQEKEFWVKNEEQVASADKLPSEIFQDVGPVSSSGEGNYVSKNRKGPEDAEEGEENVVSPRALIKTLTRGDTQGAIKIVKNISSEETNTEELISEVIALLDKEYRARVEGRKDSEDEMAQHLSGWSNKDLEKVVNVLVDTIGGNYSSMLVDLKVTLVKITKTCRKQNQETIGNEEKEESIVSPFVEEVKN